MMRDAVAPPQYGGLGAMPQPQKIFQKMNVEIAYFWHFCQLKWSLLQRRQSRIRQQALQLTWSNKTSSNLQTHPRCSTVPVDAQPVFALPPPLPSHFSADLRKYQDRVVGRLGLGWGEVGGGKGAVVPFAPPPPPPPAPAVATLMVIGRRNRDRLGLVIVILSVCPSVCLLHSWTVSTRFDLRSRFLHHIVAP